jgi:hypothetical protein
MPGPSASKSAGGGGMPGPSASKSAGGGGMPGPSASNSAGGGGMPGPSASNSAGGGGMPGPSANKSAGGGGIPGPSASTTVSGLRVLAAGGGGMPPPSAKASETNDNRNTVTAKTFFMVMLLSGGCPRGQFSRGRKWQERYCGEISHSARFLASASWNVSVNRFSLPRHVIHQQILPERVGGGEVGFAAAHFAHFLHELHQAIIRREHEGID